MGAIVGVSVEGASLVPIAQVATVAVCYAVGPVILQRWLSELPALGVITASLAVTAVAYVPIALVSPGSAPSATSALAVVALAVVCTALAFLVFFALIAEIGPVRATVITYVNPAVAAVLGVAILGEALHRSGWARVRAGARRVGARDEARPAAGAVARSGAGGCALSHSPRGEDELEAGAAVGRGLVQDLAAVRVGVGLRDREAEAGALRVLAPGKALEEPGDELLGDAVPAVGDRDPQVAVGLLGSDLEIGVRP